MRFLKTGFMLTTILVLTTGVSCQKESEEIKIKGKANAEVDQKKLESWRRAREAERETLEYKKGPEGVKTGEGPGAAKENSDPTSPNGQAAVTPEKEDPHWGCNYAPKAGGAKMVAANLTSTPSLVKDTTWQVEAQSTMSMDGNSDQTEATTDFTIIKSTLNAKTRSERYANDYAHTATFANIPLSEATSNLNRDANSCGFMMANSIKMNSKNGRTYANITFQKPFLYMLSPTLSLERFEKELEKAIEINDIRATIDTNDYEILKTGVKERVGKIEIFRIQETRTVIDSKGASITLSGDYAYRVSSKFNGSTPTKPIAWLDQVTDYYIKNGKIMGVVTQIPREEIGILVYN